MNNIGMIAIGPLLSIAIYHLLSGSVSAIRRWRGRRQAKRQWR
jgi:hypothetical protein